MSIWPETRILHGRRAAAIGHERIARPGHLLEKQTDDVADAARPKGALGSLTGVGLKPGDEFLEVVRRHVLAGDDQHRIGRHQRDRREVRQHVVRQRIDRAIEDMCRYAADAQRVAVGGGAGDAADPDAAGGTGNVFDDDGLAERQAHALGQDAAGGVQRAARRERYVDRDLSRWIGLRARAAGQGCREHESGNRIPHIFSRQFSLRHRRRRDSRPHANLARARLESGELRTAGPPPHRLTSTSRAPIFMNIYSFAARRDSLGESRHAGADASATTPGVAFRAGWRTPKCPFLRRTAPATPH